jgi:hypothetical protein
LDIPVPSAGLTAVQRGGQVLLSWPAPTLTTEGVTVRPARLGPIKVYRVVREGLNAKVSSLEYETMAQETASIPAGRTEYADRVDPSWAGRTVVYALRMTNERGESAGLSNLSALPVLSPPAAPDLHARVTQAAVILDWTPQPGAAYRVYRDGQLLATVTDGDYQDREFEFDREYRYLVRGLAREGQLTAESADSNLVTVKPEDTFPPEPPQGLRAVQVQVDGVVELSWTPNREADLAGYVVYRGAVRLNQDLLLSPTFRDPAPGPAPRYRVAAVDRKGNQSRPSEEVTP